MSASSTSDTVVVSDAVVVWVPAVLVRRDLVGITFVMEIGAGDFLDGRARDCRGRTRARSRRERQGEGEHGQED